MVIGTILIPQYRLLVMKKHFIFFFVSILCLDVWSQNKLKTQCKFGLKSGLGMHTITGCPINTHPKPSLTGGLWVQIKLSKSWTMQSELSMIGKGTGGGQEGRNYGDYLLRMSYFEVPILFQYNRKKVYFEFGPALAALINAGEYTDRGAFPFPTDLYPISNKDITFNLGTGCSFNEKWGMGLRLIHSLLPVRQQLPGAAHQVYNRSIVLAVSRQIRFKFSGTKRPEDSE
ncbi:MAG: PorT family protein [Bacteroidia bacterium]|nr:PorT family protein [Bacteroidia bacterium]